MAVPYQSDKSAKIEPKNTPKLPLELLKSNLKFITDHIAPDREIDATLLQKPIETTPLPSIHPTAWPSPSPASPTERFMRPRNETRGVLTCKEKQVDNEMIYWKVVEGDENYESSITPHHHEHDDKYEYHP